MTKLCIAINFMMHVLVESYQSNFTKTYQVGIEVYRTLITHCINSYGRN